MNELSNHSGLRMIRYMDGISSLGEEGNPLPPSALSLKSISTDNSHWLAKVDQTTHLVNESTRSAAKLFSESSQFLIQDASTTQQSGPENILPSLKQLCPTCSTEFGQQAITLQEIMENLLADSRNDRLALASMNLSQFLGILEQSSFNNTTPIPMSGVETQSFSTGMSIVLATLMTLMATLTTLGNLLVIVSFIYESQLRTVGNFYILNLAMADFLIGFICIPLYMPYLLGGVWPFGKALCRIWLVLDNVTCSASVLNIMLISSDRYLSVVHAIDYRTSQTINRAFMKMTLVWVTAFCLYGPACLFWDLVAGQSVVKDDECLPEFYTNFFFTFAAAIIEFLTPLISVSYINIQIYLNISRRSKKMREKNKLHIEAITTSTCSALVTTQEGDEHQNSGEMAAAHGEKPPSYPLCSSIINMLHVPSRTNSRRNHSADESRNGTRSSTATNLLKEKEARALKRDQKAARALAIIVGAFSLSWAPYTVCNLIRAFAATLIPDPVFEVCFWMLWLNSTINPFLYPYCHPQFRKVFQKILCEKMVCGCKKEEVPVSKLVRAKHQT